MLAPSAMALRRLSRNRNDVLPVQESPRGDDVRSRWMLARSARALRRLSRNRNEVLLDRGRPRQQFAADKRVMQALQRNQLLLANRHRFADLVACDPSRDG